MQCNVLFSHVKNYVLKIILDALFNFKSKDKYERKILNRLKRNFKRKVYINSFCLKLVSAIFYKFFIFSANDSPSKAVKNVFYFI